MSDPEDCGPWKGRRGFLSTVASATLAISAGCSALHRGNSKGGGEPISTADNGNNSETSTATPTEGPRPSLEAVGGDITIEWSPGLWDVESVEDLPEEHTTQFEVSVPNEIDATEFAIYCLDDEEDTEIARTSSPTATVAAPALESGSNQVYAEVVDSSDEKHRTTDVEVAKNIPGGYLVDLKEQQNDQVHEQGDSSVYSFDDVVVNRATIEESRQEFVEQIAYDGFVTEIESGKKFEAEGEVTAYTHYPNGEGQDYGYFDVEAWKNETEFRDVIDWIDSAAKAKFVEVEGGGPPSGYASQMAASAELAINELHPEAETRAWGIGNPKENGGSRGHGTMMFYDEAGDSGWWHVNTTSEMIVKPEDAQERRRDVWSPSTGLDKNMPGFHPGESQIDWMPYTWKSEASRDALFAMCSQNEGNGIRHRRAFLTDEFMHAAYKHIRSGGDIEKVLEPIEEVTAAQLGNGTAEGQELHTGIYGDSLDNYQIAAGEDLGGVYEKVMEDPEVVTADYMERSLTSGD